MILALGAACFSTAMQIRLTDPMVPLLAAELGRPVHQIVLLSAAFAMTYAAMPPFLGPLGDRFGKVVIIVVCLGIVVMASWVAALAPNYEILLAARIIQGAAACAAFPLSLAFVGDNTSLEERSAAVARVFGISVTGGLIGMSGAGIIADLLGWRGVFAVAGLVPAAALVLLLVVFQGQIRQPVQRSGQGGLLKTYRMIWAARRAKLCYSATFLNGLLVLGLFPYVALMLHDAGETRATVAGIVIAGVSVGGVTYSLSVPTLIRFLGLRWIMAVGGVVAGIGLILLGQGFPWQAQAAICFMMGYGFFMVHNSLQSTATEIAPFARGAAVALQTFAFFIGQAMGPLFYGAMIERMGTAIGLSIGAVLFALNSFACARWLRR